MEPQDQSAIAALSVVVEQARRLFDGDRPDDASAILSRQLAEIDPDTAGADPVLIDAGCLYAEAVRGERDARLRWAAYAFAASRRLYDGYHPRTLSSARILVELAQVEPAQVEPAQVEPAQVEPVQTPAAQIHAAQCAEPSGHPPPPGRDYRDEIADGTSLLRAYLTRLVGCGCTADVRVLTGVTIRVANR